MSPRPSTGLGITCTPMSSPTFRAAAAPASVAALTDATSPRTMLVTIPASTFCQPTNVTLAVLTIASVASTMPTNPRVSTMPSASPVCDLATAMSCATLSLLTRKRGRVVTLRGSLRSATFSQWRGAPPPRYLSRFGARCARPSRYRLRDFAARGDGQAIDYGHAFGGDED